MTYEDWITERAVVVPDTIASLRGSKTTSTILLIIVFTYSLFIEFGNLLTLTSAVVYRRLRRPKYIPVVSLAVADALVGVTAIVFVFKHYMTASRIMPDIVMKVFAVFTINASTWHLIVMAIDRFVAIIYPMQYRHMMTRSKLTKLIVVCWLFSAMTSSSFFLWLPIRHAAKACDLVEPINYVVPVAYDFGINFVQYLAAGGCLIGLNVAIVCTVRRGSRTLIGGGPRSSVNRGAQYSTRNANAIKPRMYRMVSVIISCTLVAWAPLFTVQIVRLTEVFCTHYDKLGSAYLLAGMFGTLNSGVNVIIYAWMNKDFRHAYKTLLSCRCCCQGRNAAAARSNRRLSLQYIQASTSATMSYRRNSEVLRL